MKTEQIVFNMVGRNSRKMPRFDQVVIAKIKLYDTDGSNHLICHYIAQYLRHDKCGHVFKILTPLVDDLKDERLLGSIHHSKSGDEISVDFNGRNLEILLAWADISELTKAEILCDQNLLEKYSMYNGYFKTKQERKNIIKSEFNEQ